MWIPWRRQKRTGLVLHLTHRNPPHPYPSYEYDIIVDGKTVGYCDLRLGDSEELYYAGHIGYRIFEAYRGHRYAYWASLQLLQKARDEFHQPFLYITASPENIASIKTIEHLGGKFIEEVDVPEWHWLYARHERRKCIYRLDL